jgi:hypothetical protein
MDFYYHWMPGKKKTEVDELDDPQYQKRDDRDFQGQNHAAAR